MRFTTSILRPLRYRRGYGIHSPLAFELVREVFWPRKRYGSAKYAYYSELDISGPSRCNERRAIRLANTLKRHGIPLYVDSRIARMPANALSEAETGNPRRAKWIKMSALEASSPENLPGDLVLIIGDTAVCIYLPGCVRLIYDFRIW